MLFANKVKEEATDNQKYDPPSNPNLSLSAPNCLTMAELVAT
jgi:hypothetical protein